MKTPHQSFLLILLFLISVSAAGQVKKNSVDTTTLKNIIAGNKWIHVKSIDATSKQDVTKQFPQFAGIGHYKKDGHYEFFTADNKPKGDVGTWALDTAGKKMKITSQTFGYSVEPELIRVDKLHLDFKITVRDNSGKELGTVIALHIPYN